MPITCKCKCIPPAAYFVGVLADLLSLSHLGGGCGASLTGDAFALSLFSESDVVLFMMDLKCAPDATRLLSQPGFGPSITVHGGVFL